MENWKIHTNRNTGKIETVDYLGVNTYEIVSSPDRASGKWVAHALRLEDARLIAAAPDLLEVLELASQDERLQQSGDDDYVLGRVRAAIKKARGV